MTPIPSIYAEVLEDYNNVGLDLIAKIPKYDNIKKNNTNSDINNYRLLKHVSRNSKV